MSYTTKVCSKHPTKARWKFSDEELKQSASIFKHRSEWKHGDRKRYDAAWRRGILEICCAHMEPMASPYGANYEIYVYEFGDKHVYIGLTFLPTARAFMHKVRGPVAEHRKICDQFTRKTLESKLTRQAAPEAEKRWIAHYQSEGWTLLNKNTGGCTGTVRGRKWTREAVIAEALKYQTRQEWIDGSQVSYRIAKREGWFDEASAHMPKRKLGVGAGRTASQATRRKQREAKLGGTLTKAHRDKISESVRIAWAVRSKWIGEN